MKKVILAIFGVIFASFIFSSNSYAVSDITVSIDSSSPSYYSLCGYDSGVSCSDYSYIYFTSDIYYQNSFGKSLTFDLHYFSPSSSTYETKIPFFSDYFVFSLTPELDGIKVYTPSSSILPSDKTIIVTLTDSIGGSSSTPEPEPCPDPEENSQYINVVLDSFWKYHKAFAGAVVAIIVIFLVYRLIKGVMR